MPKFPKTYYVKFEKDRTGPDYPVCLQEPIDAAEMGETVTVGLYTLTETMTVKGVAVTNTIARKRKSA